MDRRKEFEEANKRSREMIATHPRATSARYDRRLRLVLVELSSGLIVAFSPSDAEGLEGATPAELSTIEISPPGFGIYFPKLDADIYIPALLEGFLGSRSWMAKRMGQRGGSVRSKAKTEAARQNGRLGGRPKKKVTAVA
jgi:Protein of unknown function (DUF2442)